MLWIRPEVANGGACSKRRKVKGLGEAGGSMAKHGECIN